MFEITYPPSSSLVKAILALLSINQGPYLSCRYVYNAYTVLVVHTYKKVLVFRRRKKEKQSNLFNLFRQIEGGGKLEK